MCINRCVSVILCGQIVVQSLKDWRWATAMSVRATREERHIYLEIIVNINGGVIVRCNWRLLNDQQLQWDTNAPHVCSLLEQSSLDLLPGVLAALVCVHAKQDAQATGQAAGLLLQQVGLRLPLETLNTRTHRYARLQSWPFFFYIFPHYH